MALKFYSILIKKGLDKVRNVWYNIVTERDTAQNGFCVISHIYTKYKM